MHPRVTDILSSAGNKDAPIRATELYNEGWMLRLVLDWAQKHAPSDHPLRFLPDAHWYGEALLPLPFLARHRGDPLAESWTNADGVIGHFNIGDVGRSDGSFIPLLLPSWWLRRSSSVLSPLGSWTRRKYTALSGTPSPKWASTGCPPTGFGMPMLPTPLTGAFPSLWSKRRWATAISA